MGQCQLAAVSRILSNVESQRLRCVFWERRYMVRENVRDLPRGRPFPTVRSGGRTILY